MSSEAPKNKPEQPHKPSAQNERSIYENMHFDGIFEGGKNLKVAQRVFLPENIGLEDTSLNTFPITDIMQQDGELRLEVDMGNQKRYFPASMFGFTEKARGTDIIRKKSVEAATPDKKILYAGQMPDRANQVGPIYTHKEAEKGVASPERYIYVRIPKEKWETLTPTEKAVGIDAEIQELEQALKEERISKEDTTHFEKLLKEKKGERKQYLKGKKEDEKSYTYDPDNNPDAIEPFSEELEKRIAEKQWTNGAEGRLMEAIFKKPEEDAPSAKSPEELELEQLEKEIESLTSETGDIKVQIGVYKVELIEIETREREQEKENMRIGKQEHADRKLAPGIRRAEKSAEKALLQKSKAKPIRKNILGDATLTAATAAVITAGAVMTHEAVKNPKVKTFSKPAHKIERIVHTPIEKPVTKPKPVTLEKDAETKLLEDVVQKMDTALYSELSYAGKVAYLYRMLDEKEQKEHPGAYALLDKEKVVVYLISQDGKQIATGDALKGMARGDKPGLLKDDFSNKKEQGSSPAGYFEFSRENLTDAERKEGSFHVFMAGLDQGVDVHPLVKKYIEKQRKALHSAIKEDKELSAGCIRVEQEFLDILNMYMSEGSRFIILPEDKSKGTAVWIDPETYEIHTMGEDGKYARYIQKIKDILTKSKNHANI
jgi:hypothetical protein